MKFRFFISLFIVIIFILSCEFKDRANPLDPNNIDGARSLQVPSVYSTIQMAIDNAEDGDTIMVDTDTLRGDGNRNILFNGKSILLKSKYGPDSTVIDIETKGRAFIFNNEEDSLAIVDGFNIINGYVEDENEKVEGGAIFIDNSSPTIKNCIFSQNKALKGGAIYLKQSSSLLDNLTLETNFASQGHAIHIDHLSNVKLINSNINTHISLAGSGGSAITIYNESSAIFSRNIISNNQGSSGSAVKVASSSLIADNCLFAENGSNAQSNSIDCNYSTCEFYHCTIVNSFDHSNSYEELSIHFSNLEIANSIIWNLNESTSSSYLSLDLYDNISENIVNSNIMGGYNSDGILSANPMFISASDFHLTDSSECISRGINTPYLIDLDGNSRALPTGSNPDIGCYESELGALLSSITLHKVPEEYATIQSAIDVSANGDTILINDGIYVENLIIQNKRITLSSLMLIDEDQSHISNTIIDGNLNGSTIQLDNIYSGVLLNGFTIQNGFFDSSSGGNTNNISGGGVKIIYSSNNNNASVTLRNLNIINNEAYYGGGIYSIIDSLTLDNVQISTNKARHGGGIYLNGTIVEIDNVDIFDNECWDGSAITAGGISGTIKNTLMVGKMGNNSVFEIDDNMGSNPLLSNVTIIYQGTYGLYYDIDDSDTPPDLGDNKIEIINSIIWNIGYGEPIHARGSSIDIPLHISYSNIAGDTVWTGTGNINDNPVFCDPSNNDYSLASNSECINSGQDGIHMGAYSEDNCGIVNRGCTDDTAGVNPDINGDGQYLACNYDPNANINEDCTYGDEGKDCNGNCLDGSEVDECGVCGGSGAPCINECADNTNCLQLTNLDLLNNTVDVYMTNHEEIAGFQFRIDNFYIDDIIGGSGTAAANDFYMSVGSMTGTVLGFSFTGNSIPPGSGILLRLSFSDYIEGTHSCINDIILSDSAGQTADVSYFTDQYNNCITIE